MFKFLIKGLLRDTSRSRFPILTVIAGVTITVFMINWINGYINDQTLTSAKFQTGHVKIMTKAYWDIEDQKPNDLYLGNADSLLENLRIEFPEMDWLPRIYFGGLLDVPNSEGETVKQGNFMGIALNLLGGNSMKEKELLNLKESLQRGRMVQKKGEILVSDRSAAKMNLNPEDTITLISSSVNGSMVMKNFTIAGTISFGVTAMDKGAVLADFEDIRYFLNMENGVSEIFGIDKNLQYEKENIQSIMEQFNSEYYSRDDEYSPYMVSLGMQNGLGGMLDLVDKFIYIIISLFIFVLSIVLWNAGLMNGIRRYGEIGVRLAIGEDKGHIYRSMLLESAFIGFAGSVIGTLIGLGISLYLEKVGYDIGSYMQNSSILLSNTIRADITPVSFYAGFIPGFVSTFLGAALAGIGIYKRKTSQLFKELEV